MERIGSLIVFKPEVTPEQAAAALKKLQELTVRPPRIETFDDDMGGPVWYIP